MTTYRLIAAGTVEERMYEKQVFKDGLRRTLLATSGVATDRYFTKEDLKRLFTLSPVGVCEMLDRIRAFKGSQTTSPAGRLGTLNLLENHPSVVGISSHDALYKDTFAVDDNSDKRKNFQSPFAGTPFGKGMQQSLEVDATQSDEEENYIPLGRNKNKIGKKEMGVRKKNAGKKKIYVDLENDTIIEISMTSEVPPDAFNAESTLEDEMDRLLDSLAAGNATDKSEKLLLHKRIASIARELGWL